MIVVLVGPHAVGKTTTGRALAAHLGWPFDDELGRRMAEDRAHRPRGVRVDEAQPAFDRAVMEAELSRDLAAGHGANRVVETWHPGNLAYAARRSPGAVADWYERLHHHVAAFDVYVVPLEASADVLGARKNLEGTSAFFRQVAEDAVRWARALELRVTAPVRTDDSRPHAVARRVADQIDRASAGRRPNPYLPLGIARGAC